MRNLILIFFGFINLLHAQSVEFQLQRMSPCDDVPVTESTNYYLTASPYVITNEIYLNESGIVSVPKPGKYLVHRPTEPSVEPYEVELVPGRTIETVNDTRIVYRISQALNPYSYYEVCGELAQGYQEDFFPNGKVRIRGNFKDGNAVDSIVEYYDNGKRRKILLYERKGVFLTEYDSLGRKRHFRWSERKNCLVSYCGYKEIWYRSGELPMYEISDIDHVIEVKEHYPNGSLKLIQKKKKRTEYYQNGNIKSEYVWRTKRRSGRYIHQIKHQQFDENEKLIAEESEEESWSDFPQPEIAYEYNNPFWE